jgi:phosphatidylserine/phosphatidylglycerophosphate/cardiolipin synthase-like enzyme
MRFYSILLLIFAFSTTVHSAIDLQLMHTKPLCNHEGKTPAWCTYEDLKPSSEASGMVDKINAQIDLAVDASKAKIYVAYFSFSNKPIFKKLCEKATAGIPIEFFLDSSYRGNKLAADLLACGPNNVRLHFIGKMDTSNPSDIIWRLHHNKFLIVDSGNGQPVKINFSSGNLSAYGTSLHFDHWVTVTAETDSNIYKTHQCVVKSMLLAIDPDQDGVDAELDDPEVYRKTLDTCLKDMASLSVEDAITKETIAPLFSPNPKNEIANTLVQEIKKIQSGDTIRGAIQHFTHTAIASALTDACARGVNVQMIMDDDILSGESEVPGVKEFFDSNLDNTCVTVQFMQTNAAAFQMMHNKFLVLGKTRVFAGAGHFTYSAMTKNYENFYLMQTDSIVNQYSAMFDSMWQWSLTKKAAEDSLAKQAEETAQQELEEPTPPTPVPTPLPTPQ